MGLGGECQSTYRFLGAGHAVALPESRRWYHLALGRLPGHEGAGVPSANGRAVGARARRMVGTALLSFSFMLRTVQGLSGEAEAGE